MVFTTRIIPGLSYTPTRRYAYAKFQYDLHRPINAQVYGPSLIFHWPCHIIYVNQLDTVGGLRSGNRPVLRPLSELYQGADGFELLNMCTKMVIMTLNLFYRLDLFRLSNPLPPTPGYVQIISTNHNLSKRHQTNRFYIL